MIFYILLTISESVSNVYRSKKQNHDLFLKSSLLYYCEGQIILIKKSVHFDTVFGHNKDKRSPIKWLDKSKNISFQLKCSKKIFCIP